MTTSSKHATAGTAINASTIDGPSGEIYVVVSCGSQEAEPVARVAYAEVSRMLAQQDCVIVHERVFGSLETREPILAGRGRALDDAGLGADGAMTYVEGTPTWGHGLAGLVVRAAPRATLKGPVAPIQIGSRRVGLAWETEEAHCLVLQGLHGDPALPRHEQVTQGISLAEELLGSQAMKMRNVVRTWYHLDRILEWYGDFNAARNAAYRDAGILSDDGWMTASLPASTGIGARNPEGAAFLLDLYATVSHDPGTDGVRFLSNERQQDAPRYGSAFSRGASARVGGMHVIDVSGTAAIGTSGESVHVGDAAAQIEYTLDNVQNLLEQEGCSLADLSFGIAYFKEAGFEAKFDSALERRGLTRFPCVRMIADVCRDDLLFELEVTACVGE